MATRWIYSGLVSIDQPIRRPRTRDNRKHHITVRYVTPRPPADNDRRRDNTHRNDGLRYYDDVRARLYT